MQQIDWEALPADTIDGFLAYHTANPHILQRLVSRTRQLTSRGYERVGMGMLFELLRWDHLISSTTGEPFKLNNSYRAYYARLIEHLHPDLTGVYTMRQSAADRAALH
jgi:hypothetical protein